MSTALDQTFAALANQPRRQIIVTLSERPATITELRQRFDFSKQAMTRHIAILEDAGLVQRTVRGRQHHLQLVKAPLQSVSEWIEERTRIWKTNFGRLDALLSEESK